MPSSPPSHHSGWRLPSKLTKVVLSMLWKKGDRYRKSYPAICAAIGVCKLWRVRFSVWCSPLAAHWPRLSRRTCCLSISTSERTNSLRHSRRTCSTESTWGVGLRVSWCVRSTWTSPSSTASRKATARTMKIRIVIATIATTTTPTTAARWKTPSYLRFSRRPTCANAS
jgi:hypothetical protein